MTKYQVGDHVMVEYEIKTTDASHELCYFVSLVTDVPKDSDIGELDGWLTESDVKGLAPTKSNGFVEVSNALKTIGKSVKSSDSFSEQVTNITDDLADTLIAKNHDYGNAFHDSVQEFGNTVMAIRIGDKYKRLKTLLDSDAQVNESIEDTLRDLAGYAILSLIELEQQK